MVRDPVGGVRVRAPAKINLDLSVGALRADGFHPLTTVFQAVSLFDEVTVWPTPAACQVEVSGLTAGVPTDDSNLVVRAAQLVAQRLGRQPAVRIAIQKAIPVAGGLAGGSADAAAALVACDALWQGGLSRETLFEFAAELGSDVSFALMGGTAVGSGRGEQLTAALARGTYHWVLVPGMGGQSTPAVYREFDRLTQTRILPEPAINESVMQALRAGDGAALGLALHNDLQEAACSLRPELAEVMALGRECGAVAGMVSGSGPTTAFLVRDRAHGLDLSVALAASGIPEVHRVHGPVSGAKILE